MRVPYGEGENEGEKNGDKAAGRVFRIIILNTRGTRRSINTVGKCCIWNQKGTFHWTGWRRRSKRSCPKPKLWLHSSHKLLPPHSVTTCQLLPALTQTSLAHRLHNYINSKPDKVPVNSKNETHSHRCDINRHDKKTCLVLVLCCRIWAKKVGLMSTKGEQSKDYKALLYICLLYILHLNVLDDLIPVR